MVLHNSTIVKIRNIGPGVGTGVGPRYTLENPGFLLKIVSFLGLKVMFLAPKWAG